MTSHDLFVALVLALKTVEEAAVLWLLLTEHADVAEFKSSYPRMAENGLRQLIDRKKVARAMTHLQHKGLVSVRVHANYRNHIRVDRVAVLALLRSGRADPLSNRSQRHYPFLDAWEADRAQHASGISAAAPSAALATTVSQAPAL
ncbi:hypothetical protein NU688_32740 [Variovorax sp. ZS18.2.2]|uniref:hypothetical protein n=1 Tax=Variovorax sp. ZS18.2.2 TaxID=2971255 RepID=UPI002150BBA2|nr:hypothetical protein [Variovorax sp. ZS18.2.2]MCR6480964.1 hypothetical protein [Variovorax sp. ZS18.2.2]